MRLRSCLSLGIALMALVATPEVVHARSASADSVIPHVRQAMEVVGFSPGGREVILRVQDANQGSLFQVRDAKKNRVLASHLYQTDTEKRVWRRLKREHQIP
ncbi:MAG: hypothetical protein VX938_09290, partial [Myxococcota bacterium]|nr:hypothetical protein [Myxococcota bacterium]